VFVGEHIAGEDGLGRAMTTHPPTFNKNTDLARRSVTFATKCWQGDWERVLMTDHISKSVSRCNYEFKDIVLVINNINSEYEVLPHAERLVDAGVLTGYYLVRDYENAAFDFFDLSKEELGSGYVYSVSELVSIFLCRTDYLLHFSSDSLPEKNVGCWLPRALELMETNDHVKVSNLCWNHSYEEVKNESCNESDDFFVGMGFSDQNYLVRTRDFRSRIYSCWHPFSERYPPYGGELFEKRVDSWMRCNNFLRATWKHDSYVHPCYDDEAP
jgi:hypothetical protein